MTRLPRYGLSQADKDALLVKQAEMIERLMVRAAELEALVGKPGKTSSNSHIPPSQDVIRRGILTRVAGESASKIDPLRMN